MRIERRNSPDEKWVACRAQLWPHMSAEDHSRELAELLEGARAPVGFLALDGGRAVGFAEAALRSDYVNGCETSPVAFLEGLWVAPAARRQGVARALIAAVEDWARERGCRELASDADLANTVSHALHRATGFEETERVVYFRKCVGSSPDARD